MIKEKSTEVTFKFYLPEQHYELQMHIDSYRMHSILVEIEERCRREYKHGDCEPVVNFADEIRSMIWDEINLYEDV